MYDSGISTQELIDSLREEVDIAVPVTDEMYIAWLNTTEQMLYSEIIQEQHKITVTPNSDVIILSELPIESGQDKIRFEDIYTFFADGTQYIKTNLTSGLIFPETYYKKDNNAAFNAPTMPKEIAIYYFTRPALKTEETMSAHICVPPEFIEIIKSKLRGEAYKIANEDAIAAKWINDYNVLVEMFRSWTMGKAATFAQ